MASILYIEDYVSAALTMNYILGELGHECEVAATGEEAIARFAARAFDLVLVDTQLPDMDGPDVARAMRRWERENGRKPSVLVGFSAGSKGSDLCVAAGMNGFAMKSLSLADIRDLIAVYLPS